MQCCTQLCVLRSMRSQEIIPSFSTGCCVKAGFAYSSAVLRNNYI